jgi:hypothetical protein
MHDQIGYRPVLLVGTIFQPRQQLRRHPDGDYDGLLRVTHKLTLAYIRRDTYALLNPQVCTFCSIRL